jgi:hypothetical protein
LARVDDDLGAELPVEQLVARLQVELTGSLALAAGLEHAPLQRELQAQRVGCLVGDAQPAHVHLRGRVRAEADASVDDVPLAGRREEAAAARRRRVLAGSPG